MKWLGVPVDPWDRSPGIKISGPPDLSIQCNRITKNTPLGPRLDPWKLSSPTPLRYSEYFRSPLKKVDSLLFLDQKPSRIDMEKVMRDQEELGSFRNLLKEVGSLSYPGQRSQAEKEGKIDFSSMIRSTPQSTEKEETKKETGGRFTTFHHFLRINR